MSLLGRASSTKPLIVPYAHHMWLADRVYEIVLVKAQEMSLKLYQTCSYAVVPRFTCNFVPTYRCFVLAVVFLHALTIVCVFIPSICTAFVHITDTDGKVIQTTYPSTSLLLARS